MKRVVLLLVLAGCPSKSTPKVTTDAGAKPVVAPKPKPHVETSIVDQGAAADAAFHVHSRFASDAEVELFPLDDGMAAIQWADTRHWKLSTFATGKFPRAMTGRIKRDEDRGEMIVAGTTDLAFVLQRLDGVLYRVSPGETKPFPNRYTHVVEMRRGQWAGLEVIAPEESVNWDYARGEFTLLTGAGAPDAGAGFPLVPSHLRLKRSIHLADGRICADATNGNHQGGVWTADVEGHQYLAPLEGLDLLFRGADGECYALNRDYVSSELYRIKGDDAQLVAEIDFHKLGYDGNIPLQADREGGIWFIGAGFVPKRIVVTDGVVTATKYPLPEKLAADAGAGAECVHPTAMRIFALSPKDVWIFAACRDEAYVFTDLRPRVLMHTGPPEAVYAWPAP